MEKVVISVIMSVYNEKLDELKQAIDSILKQTFTQFEFIIVLDNPEAVELRTVLEDYRDIDNRISLIFNDVNIGLAASLNKGLTHATGQYIARMDADDISDLHRFEVELASLENNNWDLVSTSCSFIDDTGSIIGEHATMITNPIYVRRLLVLENFLVHPSVMGKKSVFEALSGYQEQLPASEDYDLWLRVIMSDFQIGTINQSLIKYRVRDNSMTQSDLYKTFLVSRFIKEQRLKGNLIVSANYVQALGIFLKDNQYYNLKKRAQFNEGVHIFSQAKRERKISLILSAVFNWVTCKQLRFYQKSRSQYNHEYQKLLILDRE
ncbi:glycosyl transferase 2 family protein [Latilactobacillus sakei subsp. carnosus DSM 15831]|uniref:glycosyltransferase n=1 Tax=Latilactobacillus sakei TaxID=1599 RepID=UPI00019CEDBB|nr:glycosyltransferase [Latilactobacillus sakei]AWZ46768.1 glycosyl transferase family 2 [Latilactobacillus sakei]KRL71246.1 glycosyl transferase 2 family protein [Latilactobacillus sakei subsp. carnosus DSM 15831]MCE8501082.1 glycosyltransferase [Latilactobacillus sakei]SOB40031.1 Glycosyl transferase 2 family protein [Latilactobacillus sakei]GEP21942.1 glycosyl transferase family 2 [Latilactobacillus sakei subsp. carnosus]